MQEDMTTEEARAAIAKIAALYEISFHHLPTKSAERCTWQVTLRKAGKIGDFSYSVGDAHLPSWNKLTGNRDTVGNQTIIKHERKTGCSYHTGKRFEPSAVDFLSCLARDAEAMQHDRFESWAQDYGYDEDSRAAERIYQECVRAGLFLNATLDHVQFSALQDAARAL